MSVSFDKSKVKILIVDDETSIREMLSLALTEDGWSVQNAENGKIALEKLDKEPVHIVLSDINMPEMLGTDLLKAVKDKHPQIEFLIMTSQATLETALTAIKHGAYDYLNKPFDDLDSVCRKMSQVAERIFLRQQNQELLKRLKIASQDLKRLFDAISPLSGVLKMDEFREKSQEGLRLLFPSQDFKWAWWAKDESGSWKMRGSSDSLESAEAGSLDEVKAQFPDWNKAFELEFEAEGVHDYFKFEAPKEPLGKVFSQQLETCFQKVASHLELEALANRDGLTRLFNHRYFQERLRQELSQAQRQEAELSLILLDVDHFKHYNDTHGHPAGDKLLKQLARLLDSHDRPDDPSKPGAMRRMTDIVARYGGEEFVLILPFTPLEGAMIKANRLREAIASFSFDHAAQQPLGRISVSMGVSSFPLHATTAEDLIKRADEALYKAKKQGRNRAQAAEAQSSDNKSPTEELQPTLGAILEPTGEQSQPSLSEMPEEISSSASTPEPTKDAKSVASVDSEIDDLLGDIRKAVEQEVSKASLEEFGPDEEAKKGVSS